MCTCTQAVQLSFHIADHPLFLSLHCFPAGTTPNVHAAYLVDPVDGFRMTDGRLGYPSVVKMLRDRDMKLGITGECIPCAALQRALGCGHTTTTTWSCRSTWVVTHT